jgi:hypothetical protein
MAPPREQGRYPLKAEEIIPNLFGEIWNALNDEFGDCRFEKTIPTMALASWEEEKKD